MRACACCGRQSAPTPENVLGAQVCAFIYLLYFNCACDTTRVVVLWESCEEETVTA